MGAPNGHAFTRDADTITRDVKAVELRAQHLTFQQIADALGMKNKSTAKRAVDRVLDHVQVEAADAYRAQHRVILQAAVAEAVKILYARHVLVSDGRVVRDDIGTAIRDHGPNLAAMRELRGLLERWAKLDGLDAPTQAQMTVITEDMIDLAIRELEAQVADSDRPDRADGEGPALPATQD